MAMNDRKFLAPLQWSFLCVDEGHRLKGIDSRLKQELTHYTSHEDGSQGIVCTKLLLTGTPLQVPPSHAPFPPPPQEKNCCPTIGPPPA
jgi:hypothetical protein